VYIFAYIHIAVLIHINHIAASALFQQFGIFGGLLGYFPRFGLLYQEKSGTPCFNSYFSNCNLSVTRWRPLLAERLSLDYQRSIKEDAIAVLIKSGHTDSYIRIVYTPMTISLLHLLSALFQSEYSKMLLIWQLVDGNRDEFPDESITDHEKVLFRKNLDLILGINVMMILFIYYQNNCFEKL
jgi:hypothetical protein